MTIDERSLDEAIAHAREIADKNSDCWKHCINDGSCSVCEKEHEQLAELLEELKKRRSEDYGYMADIHQSIGYRKAIDDFKKILTIEKIKEYAESDGFININNCSLMILDIAEHLKVGVKNETN